MGFIKINMNESFYAELNRSGIGGLILLHFAKTVITDYAILAEIQTIREGFLIAATSRWSSSSQLLLESDSANVVA